MTRVLDRNIVSALILVVLAAVVAGQSGGMSPAYGSVPRVPAAYDARPVSVRQDNGPDAQARAIIAVARDQSVPVPQRSVDVVRRIVATYFPDQASLVADVRYTAQDPDRPRLQGLQTTTASGANATGTITVVTDSFLNGTDETNFARRVLQVDHELEHIRQHRRGLGGPSRSAEREFLAFLRESLSPELPGTGRMPHATRVALIDEALRNYCLFGGALRTRYQSRQTELLNTRAVEQRASGRPASVPAPCPSARSSSLTPAGDVDIAFVIDTTSSMDDDIAAAQAAISEIVDAIFRTTRSPRVALVEFRDADPDEPDEFQARVDMAFTNDREQFVGAVNKLSVDGGGDHPESVYAGLMAAFRLDWRPGAAKLAIPIGDAPAKDPEPGTGYTAQRVLATAQALDPVIMYPIVIGDDEAAAASFAELALGSNGEVIPATDATDIVAAIIYALDEGVARVVDQTPPAPPSFWRRAGWAFIAAAIILSAAAVLVVVRWRVRRRRPRTS